MHYSYIIYNNNENEFTSIYHLLSFNNFTIFYTLFTILFTLYYTYTCYTTTQAIAQQTHTYNDDTPNDDADHHTQYHKYLIAERLYTCMPLYVYAICMYQHTLCQLCMYVYINFINYLFSETPIRSLSEYGIYAQIYDIYICILVQLHICTLRFFCIPT